MAKKTDTTNLASLFAENLFIPNLKAKTKNGVLAELADLLLSQNKIADKEILLKMLHQRESLGSTGIGKGIAIPHGRSLATPHLIIAFGKSEKGIPYDAMDGKPVHLFFMIIAPYKDRQNLYLVALGKLVEMLSKKKTRDGLLRVDTFQEFRTIIEGGLKE
jgi:fructose-specific phosphotransferase system IIA component